MNKAEVGIRLSIEGAQQVKSELAGVSGSVDGIGRASVSARQSLQALGAALAGAISVREFVQAADAVTQLQNQLRLATGSARAAQQAYAALYDIAQRSRVSFTDLGGTFAAIARASGELGLNQQRLLAVTEAIGNAMTVSGGSAASMQAALVQLSQGLASGTLRGEELNSVMEQTPRLARAIADGLGISIGELRKWGEEGRLSAEAVIKALESQQAALAREVQGATLTVGQALTQLRNAAVRAAGDMDEATGASNALARAIGGVSDAVQTLGTFARENTVAVQALVGAVAGAAVIASLGAAANGVRALAGAWGLLTAAMASNPIGAAAVGLTALAGGAYFAFDAWKKTESGIRDSIRGLEQQIASAEAALERARARGSESSARQIEARIAGLRQQMAQLRAELAQVDASMDTRAEDARLARMAGEASQREKDLRVLEDLRTKAAGVNRQYIADMQEIIRLNQAGVLTGDEYVRMLAQMQRQLLGTGSAKRQAAAEQDAYGQLLRSATADLQAARIEAQAVEQGMTQAQQAFLKMAASPEWERLTAQQRAQIAALYEEIIASERSTAAWKDAAKAREQALAAWTRAQQQSAAEAAREADAIERQVQQLRLQTEEIGLSAEALHALQQARIDAAIAAAEQAEAEAILSGASNDEIAAIWRKIDALRKLKAARQAAYERGLETDAAKAAQDGARRTYDEWQRTAESIERSLTDALLRGFESGKDLARNLRDTVVNMFKTLVLRPVIQAVVAPVAGAVTGALGLAGQASAATGGIGGASGVLSGLSGFGSALGVGLGAGFSSIGAAGIGGWLSAGTSLIGTGTLGGIGAGLGLLAGPVGGVLAIGGLLSSLFGDDDPRYKLLTNSSNTNPGKLFEDGVFVKSAYGNIGFDDYAKNIDANKFQETFQAIAQLDNAIAATLSPSENDRIRQALDGYVSGKDEATADYVANRLRIITDTVGGAIDQLADQFDGTSEEFVDYVSRLVQARSLIPALQDLGVALDGSSTAATQLALTLSDAFGGAQNAAQALAGYFQNYYTEAERVEVATRRLREAFAAIGVEMPATRDAFRALVEAQDLTTESGRAMYAALMQLQGAFAELTASTGGVVESISRAAEERARLERRLLELQGDTAALRQLDLQALDESNRALQQQIWALEDARVAQEAYARALEDARARFSAAESALAAARDAVAAVQQQATSAYLAAQDRVQAAQERVSQILREQAESARQAALAMRDIGRGLREFVTGERVGAQQVFADTLRRALAGDQDAMRNLPNAAREASEAARLAATTSEEARVAEARILAQVLQVARQAEGTAVPDAPAAEDALLAAQRELTAAQAELADALRVANTINAPLTQSVNNLIADYNAAVARLADAQAEYNAAQNLLRSIEGNTGRIADSSAAALSELDRMRSQIVSQLQLGFADLDTNLDGLVNLDEFLAAFQGVASEATLRALYAELDYNGDKQISLLEALQTGLVGALADGFTQIDTSLNGLVDINEFVSAFGGFASENTLRQIFTQLDVNNDQQISQFESLRMAIVNAVANGFTTLDTSVDQLLTYEEFRTGFGGLASEATLRQIFAELDINGNGVLTRLESIRLAVNNGFGAVINLGNVVTFDRNDPLYSIFQNISRTNDIMIQQFVKWLEIISGSVVTYNKNSGTVYVSTVYGYETPFNRKGGSLGFPGQYVLQYDSTNYLKEIRDQMYLVRHESYMTNVNLLNVMSGRERFWVRGQTSLFAKGGVFTNQVVDGATPFDMGVMGEAGPEAIMPLKRTSDGRLGVAAELPPIDFSRYGRNDNSDVVAEVRALRSENAAQARAIVQLQQRFTKIIERWDGQGLPEERVVA